MSINSERANKEAKRLSDLAWTIALPASLSLELARSALALAKSLEEIRAQLFVLALESTEKANELSDIAKQSASDFPCPF